MGAQSGVMRGKCEGEAMSLERERKLLFTRCFPLPLKEEVGNI